MLCKKQTVLEEACDDGTSRKVRCNVGFANTCMKFCNEKCEGYERVIVPKPAATATPPARRSAYGVSTASENAYREKIMRGQNERMDGGCCGG